MSDFELVRLLPEIIISLMACTILVIAETRLKKFQSLPFILTLATLVLAGLIASFGIFRESKIVLEGMFIGDSFAYLNKFMICLLVVVVFIYSREYSNPRKISRSEYYVLGLFSVVGMMILASANHLLTIYLGLELMSLCLYAMVAFQRDSGTATEAAMKYFVLGAIGSGSLLYGLSIIYGLTGSLDIAVIQTVISQISIDSLPLILALVFIVTGLAFKLGPHHFICGCLMSRRSDCDNDILEHRSKDRGIRDAAATADRRLGITAAHLAGYADRNSDSIDHNWKRDCNRTGKSEAHACLFCHCAYGIYAVGGAEWY